MSNGHRLTKEELRNEVKDYLISLREERIQRSREVKERLQQLRHERIERLYDVRTSLNVMESMRIKSQLEDTREDLRDSVQKLRADARAMLKRYSETRKIGYAASEKLEQASPAPTSLQSGLEGTTEKQDSALQPRADVNMATGEPEVSKSESLQKVKENQKPIQEKASSKPVENNYQNLLSKVVTGLGNKENTSASSKVSPKKENSLMGRIRRLASGDSRSVENKISSSLGGNDLVSPVKPETVPEPQKIQSPVVEPEKPLSPKRLPIEEPTPVIVSVKTKEQYTTESKTVKDNELLKIPGIGPSVLKRLERIGICTIQDLASTPVGKLEDSFGEYAKLTDLGEWIGQAKLLLRNLH